MLVLAAVPEVQYHKLRRAIAARFPVVHARTWDEALAIIRARPVELAVVDPLLAGTARARVDRRTFERWFARLGLPSPRHFLAVARVLYAHRLLQDPGFTIEDVAQRLGYAQTKTLQLHARSYLGLTAGEMRLTLEPAEALERVAQGFLPVRRAHATAS